MGFEEEHGRSREKNHIIRRLKKEQIVGKKREERRDEAKEPEARQKEDESGTKRAVVKEKQVQKTIHKKK